MMGLGWQELAIILVIVIVIFGAGKLPEIGSGLGKGIRGFKEESGIGDDKKAESAIDKGTSQTASTITEAKTAVEDTVDHAKGTRADDI
ncbi:MAG: twin-arginine translocase TatA/TatE family subunit [Thermomicrobiales bacterium]|nr:twin-arginine translocase TatA/TatE family subunit [Thermomicrobiales bacterium]